MSLVTVHEIHSGNSLDERVDIVAAKIILLRQRHGNGTIIYLDNGQRIHTNETLEIIADRLEVALLKKEKIHPAGKGDGTA